MKVNLSKLIEGKVDNLKLEFEYLFKDIDELKNSYDIVKASPFHFSGKIKKDSDKIIIYLKFTGEVIFRCSRCLKEFTKTIEDDLESEITTGEIFEENYDGIILKGDILDLSKTIEEAITLSLPMKVICNEKCKGLCSKCGVNLNTIHCSCNKNDVDPRLEKLKNFFQKDKEV